MATDIERLVISLDADINRLSKQLARATGDVETWGRNAERAAKRASKRVSDAMGGANDNRLRPDQLANLRSQALDVYTSLSGGASAFQVINQQGGQIYEALASGPGGVGGALKDLKDRALALITPARLVAAGFGGVALAAAMIGVNWAEAEDKIEKGLTGVGRKAGATVRDIYRIGDAVAASGTMSSGEARDVVSSLAQTGAIDRGQLGAVAGLAPGLAKLYGKDLGEIGPELARIFSDPVKGADELDARLGSLSGKAREYIRTLVEQGDRQGAINALIAAVKPDLDEVAGKTGSWAKAWNAVKSGADAAAVAIGKALNKGSPQDRADAASAELERSRSRGLSSANVNPADQGYADYLRSQGLTTAQVRALVSPAAPGTLDRSKPVDEAEREATAAAMDAENAAILAVQKQVEKLANEKSQAATEMVKGYNAEGEALQKLENNYISLGKAIEDRIALGKIDDPERAKASYDALGKRVEQIRAQYAAGGAAAAQALRQANFQNAVAGTSSYVRGLLEINRQFDDMRRNAIATTADLSKLPDALKSIEAARGLATKAYNTEARERAQNEVRVSPDIARIVIGAEGNNPAKNKMSSASGYGQFIDPTFLDLDKKEFSNLAAGMSDAAILGLKQDRDVNERLIERSARENAVKLNEAGLNGNKVENQYLAHFLGPGGAIKALQSNRDANAESVLGEAAARANPTIIGRGKTIGDVVDYAYGRAQRFSASGQSQRAAITGIRQEAEAYNQTAAAQERLKAINEQLNADREKGGELGAKFVTAEDLLKAKVDDLTPALRTQREEWLKLANERANATAKAGDEKRAIDLTEAYRALGRTSGEQQDYLSARGAGMPGSAEFERAYDSLQQLREVAESKSYTGGFLKDLASDLQRGTSFMDALRNATQRLLSKLLDKGIESVLSKLFGALTEGGGGSGGGLAGVLSGLLKMAGIGAASGGYISGPGSGTSDSIPARLSNGEFVVNAAATREHRGLLEAINARAYAKGGFVGAVPRIPMAYPAGGPRTVIVDRRTNAPPVRESRGPRGQQMFTIEDAERGLARRMANQRGDLGDVVEARASGGAAFRYG